jgi:hypothetical protein
MLDTLGMGPNHPDFLLWGTAYVILKWTVGLWSVRRIKAHILDRGHSHLSQGTRQILRRGPEAETPRAA